MISNETGPKTPLRDSINIMSDRSSNSGKELHGTKRSPTTPLTPLMDRYNVRRRKLVDTGTTKEAEALSSPGKGKNSTKERKTIDQKLSKYTSRFDAVEHLLFEEHKKNWILSKRSKNLEELVSFLQLERRFKVEAKSSHV
ncbi:DEBR0S4_12860g1_1 [Brettanomyces bruxellensis]|uniref:DEBR0S4_12860g1_1 n=2 Tax=Dekkera bruxellensis TaxID=5007 RepID=A0A3F2Y823_DEKBR|nr:DEBR0S4_12860g1_1 [Brettanomyces bruxellensis]